MENKKTIDINDKKNWDSLVKDDKSLDELKRPSLTFWSDAFRRLKQNKLSMVSLVFLILLIIAVIVIPMIWPRTYNEQKIAYKLIKPRIEVYDVGDGDYIHVTSDYKVIVVTKDGKLIRPLKLIKENKMNRLAEFEDLNGKSVVIDYGVKVKKETYLKELEEKALYDPTITKEEIEKARKEYENAPFVEILIDDKVVTEYTIVKNKDYLLGTDALGRDLFIRIIYGGRISLQIAFIAVLINFLIGVVYGGISGFAGGKVDNIMMRIVDIISTIPLILYVIVLMVVLTPGLGTIILAMSLTFWVGMARIVRGQVLALKEQEFVLAAKTIGASRTRILFRHILPNAMGPIMVSLTMQIPTAIFTEAFLSFIGIGVPEPIPSWGTLANDAFQSFTNYPYLLIWPSLILSLTLLAFNLLGDGLRDALDPRLRK